MRKDKTLAALIVAGVIAVGCGGGDSGGAGDGLKLNIQNGVNSSGDFMSPFDATPDPDGSAVYFTALTKDGDPAVFKSTAAKGGPITKLFSGAPLTAPVSIAISEDGKTLFIADPTAEIGDDDHGTLFTMPVGGGTPSSIGGAEGMAPRGVEVAGDQVFFTGVKDGRAGVRKVPVAGGAVTDVSVGGPFVDPSGITVTSKGVVYVADTGAGTASIVKVEGGNASVFSTGISVGYPAGIALTKDETVVLVSGFDPAKGTDTVYAIPTSNGSALDRRFSDTIEAFSESAGLHRAKHSDTFAWADSQANGTGTVYVLTK